MLGVVVLGYVAFEMWGSNAYQARQQDRLHDEFDARLGRSPTNGATTTASTTTSPRSDSPPVTATPPTTTAAAAKSEIDIRALQDGDASALIQIPRIDLEQVVVHGVTLQDLRSGPGHYPTTPLPGERGNASIAGHRTTYGAPFNRLDELVQGDEIVTVTTRGTFTYAVKEVKVVRPNQLEVLDATVEPQLTLTTCHPERSARQRLIVIATLVAEKSGDITEPSPQSILNPRAFATIDGELVEQGSTNSSTQWTRTALSFGIILAIGATWWWAYRKWRRWWMRLAGVFPMMIALIIFYLEVESILPPNF